MLDRDKLVEIIEQYEEQMNGLNAAERRRISEDDICTKLILPLIQWLGYPDNCRTGQYHLYGYKKDYYPDYLLFDDANHAHHQTAQQEDREWVQDHCLLVVEAKKPGKMPKNNSQPEQYVFLAKAVAYLISDGCRIKGYWYSSKTSDLVILDCTIRELIDNADFLQFGYDNVREIKQKSIEHIMELKQLDYYDPQEIKAIRQFDNLRQASIIWRNKYEDERNDEVYEELFAPVEVENEDKYNNLVDATLHSTKQLQVSSPIMLTAKGGQGKSTQLKHLWKMLEVHQDKNGHYDCAVMFYNLHDIAGSKDILTNALSGYGVRLTVDRQVILDDMKKPADNTGRHYILILDGLDEISSDSAAYSQIREICNIANGFNSLHVILAGRHVNFSLNRKTINMSLMDLTEEQVARWFENHHPDNDDKKEYERIAKSPMLLILAYVADKDYLSDNHEQVYVKKRPGFSLRLGEVIWNYTGYMRGKYHNQALVSDEQKKLADLLMDKVLPYVAYHDFYPYENKKGISQTELRKRIASLGISDTKTAMSLLDNIFPGIIRLNRTNWRYKFEHRFFSDYFAMIYICQLLHKLYYEESLSDEEICAITNKRIYEGSEYFEIMVCTLPFIFEFFSQEEYYEFELLSLFDSEINNNYLDKNKYNNQRSQMFRFVRAIYWNWTLINFIDCGFHDQKVITDICGKMFNALKDVAAITDESPEDRKIPDECLEYALSILSHSYRTGSLILGELTSMTILKNIVPNLNMALDYVLKSLCLNKRPEDIVDGYNYLAKVFAAASIKIQEGFDEDKNEYVLSNDDLVFDFKGLRIFDYIFDDHIPQVVSEAKVNNKGLDRQKAIERMKCFNSVADDMYHLGAKNKCVFSMNFLALKDEMEQESKEKDFRDYTTALRIFDDAARLGRHASGYSARKAVQIIAQKKAGYDQGENICAFNEANIETTLHKAEELIEIADSYGDQWGFIYMYKGLMKWNYGEHNEKTIREVFKGLCLARKQFLKGKKKEAPIILYMELIEKGLILLNTIYTDKHGSSKAESTLKTVRDAVEKYRLLLPKVVNRADKEIKEGNWNPSIGIAKEYMDTIKDCFDSYKEIIIKLKLSDLEEKCLRIIKEQEERLKMLPKKWYDIA